MQTTSDTTAQMTLPEDLSAIPTLPKIRLCVSYDSSGVNAEMVTPASEPANGLTATTKSKSATTKKTKKLQYDEMRINNAMADMQSGKSARSVAMKWCVPRTTLQNRKKAGFRNAMRPGPATVLTMDEETAL